MKLQRPWLHVIFWLAYLVFETYIEYAWIGSSYASVPPMQRAIMALKTESLLLILKIPLSYFVLYLLNDLARRKNIILIILSALAAFTIAVVLYRLLVVYIILPGFYNEKTEPANLWLLQRVISSFLNLLFIVMVVIALNQYRLYQKSREKEKGLLKEKLVAELKFLRTQTNPHFLFNTLNNIYALARKKSDDTADVVMKLSKLLRFMLYESRSPYISIAQELRVLHDYIELEKIRYNERLTIVFNRSIDKEDQPIAPLILLPFVENAFKHGVSESRFSSFVDIDVSLQRGLLIFTIENSKDDDGENAITENIGLSNVRRQLELMYPAHKLEMKIEKDRFKVALTINLQEHAAV